MNKESMIKKLEDYIYKNFKTSKAYAESKGVSVQYISAITNGNKEPSRLILKDLGLIKKREVKVIYIKE